MDVVKAETDADEETGTASADRCHNWTGMKEEMDPVLITFPSVKPEIDVS
jgi:hypothetical protein